MGSSGDTRFQLPALSVMSAVVSCTAIVMTWAITRAIVFYSVGDGGREATTSNVTVRECESLADRTHYGGSRQ